MITVGNVHFGADFFIGCALNIEFIIGVVWFLRWAIPKIARFVHNIELIASQIPDADRQQSQPPQPPQRLRPKASGKSLSGRFVGLG